MSEVKKLYAEIAKVEEQDDGSLRVYGFASTGAEDSDGEVITPEAMKAALPDYMKWGAVREMHQAKAAGTAIEAEVREDGKTWFGAHIVDSEAVKKVKAKVYKGFSIGGKVRERDEAKKSVITGLNLVEVSLVDRPANPECQLVMYKAEVIEKVSPEVQAVNEIAEMLSDGRMAATAVLDLMRKALTPAEIKAEDADAVNKPEVVFTELRTPSGAIGADLTKEHKTYEMSIEGGGLLKASQDTMAKMQGTIDALEKRVKELEAEPATGKILLKAIAKSADAEQVMPEKKVSPVLKHDGATDEVATAIKKIHQEGPTRIFA